MSDDEIYRDLDRELSYEWLDTLKRRLAEVIDHREVNLFHYEYFREILHSPRGVEMANLIPSAAEALERISEGCQLCRRRPGMIGLVASKVLEGYDLCRECEDYVHYQVDREVSRELDIQRERAMQSVRRKDQSRANLRNRRCAVYVIHCSKRLVTKVGISVNPETRRDALAKQQGYELDLVDSTWFKNVRSAEQAEKHAHRLLSTHLFREEGWGVEWFSVYPEQALEAVSKSAAMYGGINV